MKRRKKERKKRTTSEPHTNDESAAEHHWSINKISVQKPQHDKRRKKKQHSCFVDDFCQGVKHLIFEGLNPNEILVIFFLT